MGRKRAALVLRTRAALRVERGRIGAQAHTEPWLNKSRKKKIIGTLRLWGTPRTAWLPGPQFRSLAHSLPRQDERTRSRKAKGRMSPRFVRCLTKWALRALWVRLWAICAWGVAYQGRLSWSKGKRKNAWQRAFWRILDIHKKTMVELKHRS